MIKIGSRKLVRSRVLISSGGLYIWTILTKNNCPSREWSLSLSHSFKEKKTTNQDTLLISPVFGIAVALDDLSRWSLSNWPEVYFSLGLDFNWHASICETGGDMEKEQVEETPMMWRSISHHFLDVNRYCLSRTWFDWDFFRAGRDYCRVTCR